MPLSSSFSRKKDTIRLANGYQVAGAGWDRVRDCYRVRVEYRVTKIGWEYSWVAKTYVDRGGVRSLGA